MNADANGAAPRQWVAGSSVFRALPLTGARLMDWVRGSSTIIRWPDPAAATPLTKIRGGNPILFPFAGRTFADGAQGQWLWQDELRPMPRHGFARGGAFTFEETSAGFEATLSPTDEDRKAYPFDHVFKVRYAFESDGFDVDFTLENRSSVPLPWSAGHHFYFAMPVDHRAQCRLDISAQKAWYHAANGQLIEAPLPKDGSTRFDDPTTVDRIHTHLGKPEVTFGPIPGAQAVRIAVDSACASPWTTFVTWTENDQSPFYCVEPWMGPPNGPTHGHGVATVQPGQTGRFGVRVEIID